jgi:TolB protein
MKKIFLFFKFLTLLLLLPFSQAQVNLELTQGLFGSMPIVLSIVGNTSHDVSKEITKVVTEKLSLSGELKIVSGDINVPTIDSLAKYQKQGMAYVAYAKIEQVFDSSDYKLSLLFYDLTNDKNLDFAKPKKIISYKFDTKNLLSFSNVLADDLYENITGNHGLYSTKLAYVLVQNKPGMKPIYSLNITPFGGVEQKTIFQSYEPIMSPRWSHKGDKIAYVSFEGKGSAIYVQDIKTGDRIKVSDINGVNGGPSWSADDLELAIVLSEGEYTKIYQINIQDKTKVALTHGSSIDTEPLLTNENRYLFFTSNRGGSPNIYKYDLLSDYIARVTFKGDYNSSVDISPDYSNIVYLHRDGGLFSLASQDLISGKVQILSRDEYEESPSFAPNGKVVVYASKYGARGVLGFVSIDGRIRWRMPIPNGDVQEPTWSPLQNYVDKFKLDEITI